MPTVSAIRNTEHHKAAIERIRTLWDTTDEQEREELDVLVDLAEAYERRHYPIPHVDPIDAIKFRMEQMGMTNTDLAAYLGFKSRVSEILSGKRKLTVKMMQVLHHKLGIPSGFAGGSGVLIFTYL